MNRQVLDIHFEIGLGQASLTGVPWLDVLVAIGAGSVGAAIVTFLSNKWIQSRQSSTEMSRQKIQTITQMMPIYGHLGSYHGQVSEQLKTILEQLKNKKDPDCTLCFFYVCGVLYETKKLFRQQGGFVLDDLDAESVVTSFFGELSAQLKAKFDPAYVSSLPNLIDEEASFHSFQKILALSYNSPLYVSFRNWVIDPSNTKIMVRIAERSKWFRDLMLLEINQIFHLWYNSKPTVYRTERSLQEFLKSGFQQEDYYIKADENTKKLLRDQNSNYYNRIFNFEKERQRTIRNRR